MMKDLFSQTVTVRESSPWLDRIYQEVTKAVKAQMYATDLLVGAYVARHDGYLPDVFQEHGVTPSGSSRVWIAPAAEPRKAPPNLLPMAGIRRATYESLYDFPPEEAEVYVDIDHEKVQFMQIGIRKKGP